MGLELHHNPVMTPEVLHGLYVQPGGRYIDATLGEGGHSKAIIEACNPGGQVLGIDADPEAIQVANKRIDVSSDEIRQALKDNVDMQKRLGVETSEVNREELREIAPMLNADDSVGIADEPQSGYADPYLVSMGYSQAARPGKRAAKSDDLVGDQLWSG